MTKYSVLSADAVTLVREIFKEIHTQVRSVFLLDADFYYALTEPSSTRQEQDLHYHDATDAR